MLLIGLCMRANVREGKRLFWSSLCGYSTTTSTSLKKQTSWICKKMNLNLNLENFRFFVYSIGWICPSRYWNRLKVCIVIKIATSSRHWSKTMTSLFSGLDVEPLVFSFRVKFFPADPFRLTGNSKIMIYQQLKRDLIHGRLYCLAGEAAALGSLLVQGKSCNCSSILVI